MTEDTVIEMRPMEDSIRIAVTSEKINNLQRELAQHTVDDKEFQIKIFSFLQSSITDLNTTVKEISTKLDIVWDDMTLKKGKLTAWSKVGNISNAIVTICISMVSAFLIVKYGK